MKNRKKIKQKHIKSNSEMEINQSKQIEVVFQIGLKLF